MAKRDEDVQLPAPLEQFSMGLRADRKKLLKEPGWSDAAQLRQFVGQFMYPRIEDMFRLLAGVALEAYGLAAGNGQEIQRLHAFVVDELNELGANLDDVAPPGVSVETLNLLHETFYSLGSIIQEKHQGDVELVEAYQRAHEAMNRVVEDLMPPPEEDEEDDESEAPDGDAREGSDEEEHVDG
jgi:hypothetical protein